MTQAKHTPGPWHVASTSGRMIITETRVPCIAETYNEDAEANARLMAASPELLDALNAVMTDISDAAFNGVTSPLHIETRNKVRVAIAKATGEPA